MNIIDTNTKLIIQFSGEQPNIIQADDFRIDSIRELIKEDADESQIRKVLESTQEQVVAEKVSSDGDFEVSDDEIKYKGRKISGELKNVLIKAYTEGSKTLSRFKKFLNLLFENPSAHAAKELYDYIARHGCTIDQDGYIIAWKSVDQEGWSWHGNTETIVEKGQTNESGRILNVLGEEIRVARNQVDDDRSAGCSYGLHVGSYEYASTFHSDKRLMEVRVDPRDVVSIPHDCNCQKMRVCAYTPISLSAKKITSMAVNTNVESQEVKEVSLDVNSSIKDYIEDNEYGSIAELIEFLQDKGEINISPQKIVEISENLGFNVNKQGSILDWDVSDQEYEDDSDDWDFS